MHLSYYSITTHLKNKIYLKHNTIWTLNIVFHTKHIRNTFSYKMGDAPHYFHLKPQYLLITYFTTAKKSPIFSYDIFAFIFYIILLCYSSVHFHYSHQTVVASWMKPCFAKNVGSSFMKPVRSAFLYACAIVCSEGFRNAIVWTIYNYIVNYIVLV